MLKLKIELMKQKLYKALERGDQKNALKLSVKLDSIIVKYYKSRSNAA